MLVPSDNAHQLWETRKTLFFKPAGGHGSKAVYRGDKLTMGVWAEIIRGGYVAQEFAAPSKRMVKLDGFRRYARLTSHIRSTLLATSIRLEGDRDLPEIGLPGRSLQCFRSKA